MSKAWSAGSTRAWRKVRALVLARDGYRCKIRLPGVCTTIATTADHIVPRGLGGSDDPGNLRAACKPCNDSRGGSQAGPGPSGRRPLRF